MLAVECGRCGRVVGVRMVHRDDVESVALQLLPQVANVDVDRPRVAVVRTAPDCLEQSLASEDPPGPRGERTYGELRGFYAAERVVTYFRDLDPAFIDARSAADDPTGALLTDAIGKVRAPVLVLAGEPRLGGAVDDAAEWKLKKLADVQVKRFPGSGHLIHGFRPEQFIENIEPFLRKIREGSAAS